MASFFPPPLNRLVLEAWSAGVYCAEENCMLKSVKDLPSQRGSIAGTREEVTDHESGSPELFYEDDAELPVKHSAFRTQE